MNLLLATLGDSIRQIGGGLLVLIALVLIFALGSPEVHLSSWHRWFWIRLTFLVCFSLFLVLSAGVVLFHGANTASTVGPAATQPVAATATPRGGSSPAPVSLASPTPLPSPSPFPRLVPGPARVLTTYCDAINRQVVNVLQCEQVWPSDRSTCPPM